MIFPELYICAADEVDNFANKSITHIISIRNPGSSWSCPFWFKGSRLELHFGDVVSRKDAETYHTLPPSSDHLRKVLEFTGASFNSSTAKTLIFCDYGASRSPAVAYVALAAHCGPGKEKECFDKILAIRPEAVPNSYIVHLGDSLLLRDGALISPYQEYIKKLFREAGDSWRP